MARDAGSIPAGRSLRGGSMASIQRLQLFGGAISGTTVGETRTLEGMQVDFVSVLDLSAISATNVVVKVQRSHNGSDWFDWITHATLTAPGKEAKDATVPGLSYVRVQAVATGGAATGTAVVTLHFDKRAK